MTATPLDAHAAAGVVVALAALPVTQASVLRLLYFERLSDHEVAARLGLALKVARAAAAEGLRDLGVALLRTP